MLRDFDHVDAKITMFSGTLKSQFNQLKFLRIFPEKFGKFEEKDHSKNWDKVPRDVDHEAAVRVERLVPQCAERKLPHLRVEGVFRRVRELEEPRAMLLLMKNPSGENPRRLPTDSDPLIFSDIMICS